MIQFIKPYFSKTDGRGTITGIIQETCSDNYWKELNLIVSKHNSIHGNHYHKETKELFIIINGIIRICAQRINNNSLEEEIEERIVMKNDVFIINPFINHTFYTISEQASWINVLSKAFQNDIYKIEET